MTTTINKTAIWHRAATMAMQVSAAAGKPQQYTFGKPRDARCLWANIAGTPECKEHGEPGAIAVVCVEWRKPESFGDDDASVSGYWLSPDGQTARCAAHASVHRNEDGTLRLGEWDIKPPQQIVDFARQEFAW